MAKASLLFIGKKDDFYCQKAVEFVNLHFPGTPVLLGTRHDPFPAQAGQWQGDYIISYLSPWIIPQALLDRAGKAAINFHPGPPEYPGIGCTNFAIYAEEKIFGITCHHMDSTVDTGKIIAVRRFPLYETDTVFSLTHKCYAYILVLFYEITSLILEGKALPQSPEGWAREAFKRRELNALCEIEDGMPPEEIRRRVRAVTFPNAPGAYMMVAGKKVAYGQ